MVIRYLFRADMYIKVVRTKFDIYVFINIALHNTEFH